MVLEVLPNAGKVLDELNPCTLQILGGSNTAELQDLRGVDGARGEDDLALGADGLDLATSNGPELDGGNILIFIHDDADDLVLNQEVKVGPVGSNVSIVADAGVRSLDGGRVLGSGDPAEAVLVAVGAVARGLEAEFLKGFPSDLWRGEGGISMFASLNGGGQDVAVETYAGRATGRTGMRPRSSPRRSWRGPRCTRTRRHPRSWARSRRSSGVFISKRV